MRVLTVACAVFGPVLVALSFLTDAFRPYLLYAGIAVLLLGLVPAAVRTLRRRGPSEVAAVGDMPSTADVAVLEPAPPVAPPRAEVTILLGGNAASEPRVRWYQVAAATGTHVAAKKARVNVSVRGEQVGAEHWQWLTGERAIDLTQTGARVPIVIGGVSDSSDPLASGWAVPFKNWFLTPYATSTLGPFLAPFIAGVRQVFDVSVCWDERGVEQRSAASFELRFWREPTSEPRFMRLGDRPSYRDQIGGLGELRDKGMALRKEAMMLPLASLGVWLGRVDSWTSETRALIAEVSTADSDYFWALKNFEAPLFEGVRIHDERHRKALRELHERLIRLQHFIKPGTT